MLHRLAARLRLRGHRGWRRALVVFALSVAVCGPAPATATTAPNAHVPGPLRAAAAKDAGRVFDVIVQGVPGTRSAAVAAAVAREPDAATRRRFQSISGVAARLTGRELLHLAEIPGIYAITVDAPVRAHDLLPPTVVTPPAPEATPPAVTTAPTVAGTAEVGAALTASPGEWTGSAPLALAYRWLRCDASGEACAAIAGAIDASYAPAAADVGSTLRAEVTATNAGGSASATSAATPRITPTRHAGRWSWQLWPYAAGLPPLWDDTAASGAPTIAIVDSGVDPSVPDLAGRVTKQVPITTLPDNAAGDGRGHGTFVASLAVGAADGRTGAAPTANIVSLDVLDDHGGGRTSDVIAAADWIYEHHADEGIRVANFSLTGSVGTSFEIDPLDRAIERLWLAGVVVVAAAGNYGTDAGPSGVPYAPANDPLALTVGATDVAGTEARQDDFTAPWSAYGSTMDGFAKPELVAPGRSILGPVPPNATLALERPDRVVEPGLMRLSGTSLAAPVVAGAAANLLAVHPDWTPDQVKGALMQSATPLPQAPNGSAGVGGIDAAAAAAVGSPANPNAALEQFVVPDPDGGPTPVIDTSAWAAAAATDPTWAATYWGSTYWGSTYWGSTYWGSTYWGSTTEGATYWGSTYWGSTYWGSTYWGSTYWGSTAADSTTKADSGAEPQLPPVNADAAE